MIIDAQGLVKSGLLSLIAHGIRSGLDWKSAREPLASVVYNKKCSVNVYQHAVIRMRSIFSQSLNYKLPDTVPNYGINRERFRDSESQKDYLVFLHSTTWETKLWPEDYWVELAKCAASRGMAVKMLWGNEVEQARVNRLAQQSDNIETIPSHFNLGNSAKILANARAVVAVDTGLMHLAAALNVPTISLYGPTNPEYTGAMGQGQIKLAANFPCAPCLKRECTFMGNASVQPACISALTPDKVCEAVRLLTP